MSDGDLFGWFDPVAWVAEAKAKGVEVPQQLMDALAIRATLTDTIKAAREAQADLTQAVKEAREEMRRVAKQEARKHLARALGTAAEVLRRP